MATVRRGMEDIQDFNKKRSAAAQAGYVPEVFSRLRDDGEYAVVRIITDSPVDMDMHSVYDEGLSRRFLVYCPGRDECDYCHEGDRPKAWFAFWTWVHYLVHADQDKDGLWKKVDVGGRTMYREDINQVMLMRKTHGQGNQLWNIFEEIFGISKTFTDKDVRIKRKGIKGDKETSYTVLQMDKSPMPKEAVTIIGKLPDLVAVMKGEVKNLDSLKGGSVKEEWGAKVRSQEKTEVEKPPVKKSDDDDLFEEKKTKPVGAAVKKPVVMDDDDDLIEEPFNDED